MQAPHPDYLKALLTQKQWSEWEQFYAQDPWGELRADLRALVVQLHHNDPHCDAELIWPYFQTDAERADEELAMNEGFKKRALSLDPVAIEAKLKAAKEKYLAAKEKRV